MKPEKLAKGDRVRFAGPKGWGWDTGTVVRLAKDRVCVTDCIRAGKPTGSEGWAFREHVRRVK